MPDLLEIVAELASAFDHLQLRFALGGALATSYWGIVRTTQDVDCLISIPAIKYQQLADELQVLGFRQRDEAGKVVDVAASRMREQALERKLIECYRDSVRIELFVPVVPLQEEILRRALAVQIGGREVPITTAEDLILIKLAFHRSKDLQDVRGILWIQGDRLDLEYLQRWSSLSLEADVQRELEQLIGEYHGGDSHGSAGK
jgi:predicted nucleotidyltransferase